MSKSQVKLHYACLVSGICLYDKKYTLVNRKKNFFLIKIYTFIEFFKIYCINDKNSSSNIKILQNVKKYQKSLLKKI
jgi:hypothetical protein